MLVGACRFGLLAIYGGRRGASMEKVAVRMVEPKKRSIRLGTGSDGEVGNGVGGDGIGQR